MANLYITRASLEVNGQTITDFKGVTEKEVTLSKVVPLMYKTGTAKLTKRYQIEMDYVVPQLNPFDFTAVQAGTITIEYDGGQRDDFGSVTVLTVGDKKVDGENETVQAITFMAESKNGNTGV